MKKNNKGFMLIEVIVTSTIVMTSMIALYTSFNKLQNNYRIKNTNCNNTFSLSNCEILKDTYKIKNVVFSLYDNNKLKEIKTNETLNQTFYDYIDYIIDYYDIKQSDEYNYIILTEIEEGDNQYYANLRIR